MNKTEVFSLKWYDHTGRFFKRNVKRADVLASFEGIEKGFPEEKHVTKKFVNAVSEAQVIFIDYSERKKIRYINSLGTYEEFMIDTLSISNILWSILKAYCIESKSENGREIVMKWRLKNKTYSRKLNREKTRNIFLKLKRNYINNCEFSTKLSEIFLLTDEFYINWDSTKDVNSIYFKCKDYEDNYDGNIDIPACHKIVWQNLKELCTPE